MTSEPHQHDFPPSEWPFSVPDDTVAITTARVLRRKQPILVVSHDEEGDWQFLHGAVGARDKPIVLCLGCVYGRDRSVGQVADLPPGWQAIRSSVDEPWERLPP